MNENELKEPMKWVITPNGTLEVSLQNQTYIVECSQIVVDAHNLATDTLYKQVVTLRDELDAIKRSVDFFPSYSESISNRVEAICFEYRRIHQVLTSSEHANNTASEIALARRGEAAQSSRARLLESKLKQADSTIDKLQLELAQLRQLIEQDAKAREIQSEAEKKVGGV